METATLSPPDHPLSRRSAQKARVTNHIDLLPNIDGNSPGARRFRDLVNAFITDQGGIELCPTTKIVLARQLAAIIVKAEDVAAMSVNGEKVDISQLCTLASTVMRLSMRLGFERVAKPVPSMQEYLRSLPPESPPLPIEDTDDAVQS